MRALILLVFSVPNFSVRHDSYSNVDYWRSLSRATALAMLPVYHSPISQINPITALLEDIEILFLEVFNVRGSFSSALSRSMAKCLITVQVAI